MKKVILTEQQEKLLVAEVLYETKRYPVQPDKVLLIKKFLDKNFKRASMSQMGGNGMPETIPVVGMIDSTGNVVRNLNSHQLFDLLQDKFYNMFSDTVQRDKLIVQVIKDWYAKKINDNGLLSVNNI